MTSCNSRIITKRILVITKFGRLQWDEYETRSPEKRKQSLILLLVSPSQTSLCSPNENAARTRMQLAPKWKGSPQTAPPKYRDMHKILDTLVPMYLYQSCTVKLKTGSQTPKKKAIEIRWKYWMFDCLDVGRSVQDAASVRSIIAYIEEPTTSDATPTLSESEITTAKNWNETSRTLENQVRITCRYQHYIDASRIADGSFGT